ncbi:SDR family NAD(P)-dependent oxidoreductase [Saccharothrix variisporea]|uniref:NAD(P)-dependent dehydrogenase (Short-subunit alcohol dehydrogenase family) n=1 Tax=Saccharothrix variisporea TaxID=543527 RepID=A0A495XM94_9PSEU|nr:SDR family NAD(P)-dependent oxidoreductase [Saccharothrix variisporea]RKT74036.1 NAD(P)-dependent dehydrogenase (short-subunit alcohol dehydrogenase family) [Saccharothrix variisporea]
MGFLDGKAVVITGAGSGLGEAYARHAAREGASVVVNDLAGAERVVADIRAEGGTAIAHTGDVTKTADELITLCRTEFGAVDGLVNNAGTTHFAAPWDDDPETVRRVVEVNVLGTMFCGIAAAKVMRGGSIVNVASGAMLGRADAAAYSASKGAVAALTASWAGGMAERGVRVNAVCPLAWTGMMERDPRRNTFGSPDTTTAARMAPLVTYLLADASQHITGQLIRFLPDKLHVIAQYAVKQPVLVRDTWDTDAIAAAFHPDTGDLRSEPPGRDRWRV